MATAESPYSLPGQIDFLSDLVQSGPLYSSVYGQQACAQKLADKLDEFGWDDIAIQDYTAGQLIDDPCYVPVESFGGQYVGDEQRPKQNIIGILRGSDIGKTLILNGHYDIEPINTPERWHKPWNSGEITEEKVWGRGSSDMLGGLSSQLYVASRLAENRQDWAGQVVFNAVADEEVGGNGTLASLHMMREEGLLDEPESVACLIAEPSNKVIALESLGFLHMILRAQGVARHMAGVALRDNVLYDMIDAIKGFQDVLDATAALTATDRAKFWHAFGVIQGGVDAATPMPEVLAESTIFYPSEVSAHETQEAITEEMRRRHPLITPSFSDFYFDGHASRASRLTNALTTSDSSEDIKTGIFSSPCDARLFTSFNINEVIVYGPGSLAQAHGVDEFIKIDDIKTYNAHLEAAVRSYLQ